MKKEDHEENYIFNKIKMDMAIEAEEMNLISVLKPRIGIDGNQWFVLWGDNLQDGVAGFGDTPRDAVLDFNESWDKPLNKEKTAGVVMEGFSPALEALKSLGLKKC